MVLSEARKRTTAKWDKEHMVNVSCRITKEKKEAFKTSCDSLGTTMNAVLLTAVNDTIKKAEK